MPSEIEEASPRVSDSGIENNSLSSSSAASSASSLSSMASFFSEGQVQPDGVVLGDEAVGGGGLGLQLPPEVSLLHEPGCEAQEEAAAVPTPAEQPFDGFSPVLHLPPLSEFGPSSANPSPSVGPGSGYNPAGVSCLERVVETRVHPRTALELAMVDESPACLTSPSLDAAHPRTGPCYMSWGGTGRAKAFRGPTEEHRGVVTLYGEDAVAMGELTVPVPMEEEGRRGADYDQWARILAVFDGHGLMGKDAARVAAERLLIESDRAASDTLAALLRQDVGHVKAIEHKKYSTLDAFLEQTLKSPTGGTTCSSVQLLRAQYRLFMVASNVGDSPVLLINNTTKHVKVISGRHSWDNPEERLKYLQRCSSLGLPAREVVYGRINCGGMRMEDLRGGMEEPFYMYKPGTAVIDPQSRDHLCKQVEKRYKNSIGGSQSIRRFVVERRTFSGSWETSHAMMEHGHVNWGATILVNREGKIQMSRSLGDLHEKQTAYIWSEPDVSIYEFSPGEDATVIVCSDGISDLWYFHELGELAADFFAGQPGGEAQDLADQILELTLDRGAKTPGYGIGGGRHHPGMRGGGKDDIPVRRPGWDDVALQVIHIRCPDVELPVPPPMSGGSVAAQQQPVVPPAIPMEEETAGSV